MSTTMRARYDGQVFVPEQPVDLTPGESVEFTLPNGRESITEMEERLRKLQIELRLERLRQACGTLSGPTLPDEALERESLYEGRP